MKSFGVFFSHFQHEKLKLHLTQNIPFDPNQNTLFKMLAKKAREVKIQIQEKNTLLLLFSLCPVA